MKYEEEYKHSKDRKDFFRIMNIKYPLLKKSTLKRYEYSLRKKFGEIKQRKNKYDSSEKIKPSILKMHMIEDFKKFNHKFDRKFLRTYGFAEEEINWLEDEGEF